MHTSGVYAHEWGLFSKLPDSASCSAAYANHFSHQIRSDLEQRKSNS